VAEVYEFHIAGLVGPVVRAALSDLTSHDGPPMSLLSGTADSPAEIDNLLRVLYEHGVCADRILLTRHDRWHQAAPASGDCVG
jgi:hypothetical protein